jgi:hypothetical protein
VHSPNVGTADTELEAVTAISGRNAWAVGHRSGSQGDRSFVLHWNGRAWRIQKSPNTSATDNDDLLAVTATSPSNAWAVGTLFNAPEGSVILHWNGRVWKIAKKPNLGVSGSTLEGVVATSGHDAWAVGARSNGTALQTLVLHWNGSFWKVLPTPNQTTTGDNILFSVAAASPADLWAVGLYRSPSINRTLALHCC